MGQHTGGHECREKTIVVTGAVNVVLSLANTEPEAYLSFSETRAKHFVPRSCEIPATTRRAARGPVCTNPDTGIVLQ